jgi:hypothetical protein
MIDVSASGTHAESAAHVVAELGRSEHEEFSYDSTDVLSVKELMFVVLTVVALSVVALIVRV